VEEIYEWIVNIFMNTDDDALSIEKFPGPQWLQGEILHHSNLDTKDPFHIEISPEAQEQQQTNEQKKEQKNDEDEDNEFEDEEDKLAKSLRYILPDGRRARMHRILQKPPLTIEVENTRLITEAGAATEEAKAILRDVFTKFDKDNDGKWRLEEWNEYLQKSGSKSVTKDDWEKFLEANKAESDDSDEEDDDEEGEHEGKSKKKE